MENRKAHNNDFAITKAAAERICALKKQNGAADLRFRITVKGGGCSGFQYEFSLDIDEPASSDFVITSGGAEVVIDDVSISLLSGAVLDYAEDLSHAGFEVKNPNAVARCGCGNSFSVAL